MSVISSAPKDLDGLRRLIAFKISQSETGAKDKNSEDDKGWRRRQGKDIRQQLHKVRPSTYYEPQDFLGCEFKLSSIDWNHLNLSDIIIVAYISLRQEKYLFE
jgi:hypothetical protein